MEIRYYESILLVVVVVVWAVLQCSPGHMCINTSARSSPDYLQMPSE